MKQERGACEERSVAALYKDSEVSESYIHQRFRFSWSRLLHNKQVAEVNRVISVYQPASILEVAPGPARIATDLRGVRHGVMIEYSEEMLALARRRLAAAGCESVWNVQQGNAFDLDQLGCQFDLLYTFRFIRHFRLEERVRLYHGMRSCLKPGGLFMFDVVNRVVRQKVDAKKSQKSTDELDVYDVTYSEEDFRREMEEYGFTVLYLRPVIVYFPIQSWLSYTLDHRIGKLSYVLVNLFEKIPSQNPLEWIAVCRKVG